MLFYKKNKNNLLKNNQNFCLGYFKDSLNFFYKKTYLEYFKSILNILKIYKKIN